MCYIYTSEERVALVMNSLTTHTTSLFGTGEGKKYTNEQLDGLLTKSGEEIKLYRFMCDTEYDSLNKNNCFLIYDNAMEKKWFATNYSDAEKWRDSFKKFDLAVVNYVILEVTLLKESLKFMFFSENLDNIGDAYSADVHLLNKIIRRWQLV